MRKEPGLVRFCPASPSPPFCASDTRRDMAASFSAHGSGELLLDKGGGFKKRKHDNIPRVQRKEEKASSVDTSSPVVMAFKSFQHELDAKHDKYERLVKLGRDITIESKRTIFILHRVIRDITFTVLATYPSHVVFGSVQYRVLIQYHTSSSQTVSSVANLNLGALPFTASWPGRRCSDPNKDGVLKEADSKLDLVRQKIKQIAEELVGEDLYQYHRAFTPGLQEYVEAVTFQHFIKTKTLLCLEDINKQLIFEETKKDVESNPNDSVADPLTTVSEKTQFEQSTLSVQVTPVDYLLGVADLTGELMRLCIGSVGNGDIDTPFELSQFLREIFDGFSYIGNTGPYEISRKLYTLKQSLAKVENACYTLKVRGSEIPKHMLADLFSTKSEIMEHDEGIS
uniref:SprT-like N-terminal domain n=1 Tax=Leptobrachium leishanense TaxID=445787 RepID=A0A8C5MLZ0_9ANUR